MSIPHGCYVMPDSQDKYIWHGVLFVHEGPFIGLVLRFSMKLDSYKQTGNSLFSIGKSNGRNVFVEEKNNFPSSKLDSNSQSFNPTNEIDKRTFEFKKCSSSQINSFDSFDYLNSLNLPIITITSVPDLLIHPLVKNYNQLDISFFILWNLNREAQKEICRLTHLPTSDVVQGIADCFTDKGIDAIVSCSGNPEYSQFIHNSDAMRILLNDRNAFCKLAKEAVKASNDEEVLYKKYEGCSFQFKTN